MFLLRCRVEKFTYSSRILFWISVICSTFNKIGFWPAGLRRCEHFRYLWTFLKYDTVTYNFDWKNRSVNSQNGLPAPTAYKNTTCINTWRRRRIWEHPDQQHQPNWPFKPPRSRNSIQTLSLRKHDTWRRQGNSTKPKIHIRSDLWEQMAGLILNKMIFHCHIPRTYGWVLWKVLFFRSRSGDSAEQRRIKSRNVEISGVRFFDSRESL